jgi:hypothetical protein
VKVRSNALSTASAASDLGAGFFVATRVALVLIAMSVLGLVVQSQRGTFPIYFHHHATLRAKDPGMDIGASFQNLPQSFDPSTGAEYKDFTSRPCA